MARRPLRAGESTVRDPAAGAGSNDPPALARFGWPERVLAMPCGPTDPVLGRLPKIASSAQTRGNRMYVGCHAQPGRLAGGGASPPQECFSHHSRPFATIINVKPGWRSVRLASQTTPGNLPRCVRRHDFRSVLACAPRRSRWALEAHGPKAVAPSLSLKRWPAGTV
jgi:hypothetical protein